MEQRWRRTGICDCRYLLDFPSLIACSIAFDFIEELRGERGPGGPRSLHNVRLSALDFWRRLRTIVLSTSRMGSSITSSERVRNCDASLRNSAPGNQRGICLTLSPMISSKWEENHKRDARAGNASTRKAPGKDAADILSTKSSAAGIYRSFFSATCIPYTMSIIVAPTVLIAT